MTTEWMSKEETLEYLRLDPDEVRALYRLVENAKLPAYRLGKKNLIFSRTDLDEYIRSHRAEPRGRRKKGKPS